MWTDCCSASTCFVSCRMLLLNVCKGIFSIASQRKPGDLWVPVLVSGISNETAWTLIDNSGHRTVLLLWVNLDLWTVYDDTSWQTNNVSNQHFDGPSPSPCRNFSIHMSQRRTTLNQILDNVIFEMNMVLSKGLKLQLAVGFRLWGNGGF